MFRWESFFVSYNLKTYKAVKTTIVFYLLANMFILPTPNFIKTLKY